MADDETRSVGDVRRVADRLGFVAVASVVLVGGFLQGRIDVAIPSVGLVTPGGIVLLNAAIACLGFAASLVLSGVILLADVVRARDPDARPSTGPAVAAIVPCYGDAAALDRSVGSLLAARYRDLVVYVVCEPGDTPTIERARSLAEHDRVEVLVSDRAAGSKAAAINGAVAVTDSDYVGVFDADERVHPEFVAAGVGALDEHDVFQGRTVPRPDGPLETLAYYESVVLGYLSQRILVWLTSFRTVTSNVVVMRRETYERVGGYDPGMLTEDLDFAFRCYGADVDVRESLAYPSEIEAAHTVRDWWGQRKRWMTGYAQVFHRLLGRVRPVRSPRSVLSLVVCGGAILGNVVLLSLVSQLAVLALAGAVEALAAYVVSLWVVGLAVRATDVRFGNVDGVGLGWLAVPFALPLYSLAGIKGFVEYPISWRGEWYRVTKSG